MSELDGYREVSAEDVEWEVADDHRCMDVPAFTALMHRDMQTYVEAAWIRGYPNIRRIIVTVLPTTIASGPHAGAEMPGVIADVPVGWRDMASSETFRTRCEQEVSRRIAEGWARKDTTTVWSGDPWDTRSTLDEGPSF